LHHERHEDDIRRREQGRHLTGRPWIEERHVVEPAAAGLPHQFGLGRPITHQHEMQRRIGQQLGGGEYVLEALRQAVQAGVECDAAVRRAEGRARRRRTAIGVERATVDPVREMVRATPGEPVHNIRDDGAGLTGHQRGAAVTEALESSADLVRQTAAPQYTQPHGGLGPQVGHVEDHRATLHPAQPHSGETEKQRRTFDDQVGSSANVPSAADDATNEK